ncbi:hypothetical protein V5O48_005997, partial [Marasmius crinis-equi]
MDDHQLASSSSSPSPTTRDPQRKRLSGFFNAFVHRRDPPPAIQEEPKTPSKAEETPQPAPAVPPPRLPPPTLQELGLSLSVVTENLHPSHFTTPPSSGAFLSPNYLLLCHAQGLDVLPITSPPEPQPLPLIRRVSFKSIVVMEQRGVLVAIAGRRENVRVYALEEIRKAVEWRVDVQLKRERERQRREQAKKAASSLIIESRLSNDKFRKPSSSTPPPGAETSAKVSIPRKGSQSSITPTTTAFTQPPVPPVPLIPRTPTIRKLKPPKKSPAVPPSVPSVPEPSGLPPPYPSPEASDYFSQPPLLPSRATSVVTVRPRPRGASVSEVLSVPPLSRLNTSIENSRPHDQDAKGIDWVESSDEEAINVVAAGASGSQALDERTSAVHSSTNTQSTTINNHAIITTPPHSHRRSLSRRNRPANLDLSLTINNPVAPSEPSPAPTLLTLRQALANGPSSVNAETASDNPDLGLADLDDDDDEEGGAISLSQALMESRIPDLPPPGSTRPQQPIYISSSHSLAAGEDEPASPRTSEAHSARSEMLASSSSTSHSNRRRRWSFMLNSNLSGSSSTPTVDRPPPSPTTVTPTASPPREQRSNRLSRSHSHRSNTSAAPARRPSSANPETSRRTNASETIPPLPTESSTPPTSSSRSRFIPRIISNAFHNMRSDDRPTTSPGGFESETTKKANSTSLTTQPPAAKLEYVKLPGTKGSLMIKAVETAKKSFLAILCGDNGEKVELFAGTYRTALGLSRTFILPDSPRSLELQLQGDDLVEVFLVFSQNVFGLEPATVRVREVRIGRAERRAARRRAREARDAANTSGNNDTEGQGDEETNVNVSIGVSVSVGSTVVATGSGTSGPSTPALIPSEHPQQQQEDRAASSEGNAEGSSTPAEGAATNAVAHAEELVALATAQMGPYTTFQQLSFAPRFPLASIADDYVIPPTYPDFMDYRQSYEPEEAEVTTPRAETDGSNSGSSSADPTVVQFSPPGLPVPTPTAPSKWFYLDPKGVVHGPWKASLMQTWYKDSLLPADLPVRREEDTEFIPLKDLRSQSIDPSHPFSPAGPVSPISPIARPLEPPLPLRSTSDDSSTDPPFQTTDKPLLKPISLLAQPRHFGPPALFYSSRG